jgi:hypothetical protein
MSQHLVRKSISDVDAVIATATYREPIERLRIRIRESQTRAARTLNTELVMLYWSIGRDILDQQQAGGWGDDVVGPIAQDLAADTGSARGFSRRNLFYMRRFAALWPDSEIVQTLSAQIGWSHHQVLIDAFGENPDLYAWYAAKTAEDRWAVRYLKGQINLRLHERQGAALTNFPRALEPADADRALQAIKDPYVFDFLELTEDARERHLEQALIDDIQRAWASSSAPSTTRLLPSSLCTGSMRRSPFQPGRPTPAPGYHRSKSLMRYPRISPSSTRYGQGFSTASRVVGRRSSIVSPNGVRTDATQAATIPALPASEAEAFHLIRAHLRYFNVDRELRTLLVASAAPGDGKTTVARHLAAAAARARGCCRAV